MYVTAADFVKAYNSVRRNALVETLNEYQGHPNFIELTADLQVYKDDATTVKVEKDEDTKMSVSSGIKQGCTASTTL